MGRMTLFLLAVLVTTPVAAAELAGVSMPDEVTVRGTRLVLNGLGLREWSFLRIDVYVAGLYLRERMHDPEAIIGSPGPKRLELRMVRSLDRSSIAESWAKGIRKSAGKDYPALEDRVASLNSQLTDVRRGDTVALTQIPGEGTVLEMNDKTLATVPGEDFARALWRIWLGATPPTIELKKGLLGAR